MHPPYTEDEAREARLWVNKHGPSNSWTAGGGTAARMIGRLLKERERLLLTEQERSVLAWMREMCLDECDYAEEDGNPGDGAKWAARATALDGILRRTP